MTSNSGARAWGEGGKEQINVDRIFIYVFTYLLFIHSF